MMKEYVLNRVVLRALLAIFIVQVSCVQGVWGQDAAAPAAAKTSGARMVELNLPEKMNLKTFIAYISKRLDLNILYDDKKLGDQQMTIIAPNQVPADSVMGLLESLLKNQGLALVDAEQTGWKRVVKVNKLVDIAHGIKDSEKLLASGKPGITAVVTRVFYLKHIGPSQAKQLITPYLTSPTNTIELPEHNMLIVTDYASAFDRIVELLELVDRPSESVSLELIKVRNQKASELAKQVTEVLKAKESAMGIKTDPKVAKGAPVEIIANERTNQLIVAGTRNRVAEAVEMIGSLDVSLGLEVKVYYLDIASPERIDMLTRELIGEVDADRIYRSAIDSEMNFIVVTATPEVHRTVQSLKEQLDVPDLEKRSPIKFYKLENASAVDVLATLSALEQSSNPQGDAVGATAMAPGAASPATRAPSTRAGMSETAVDTKSNRRSTDAGGAGTASTVKSDRLTMTADINTNSIIIIAKPEVHQIYAKLIQQLDQRRPQVLIEATVVVIDTTDDFKLGVEVGRKTDVGDGDMLLFSSFGLSTVDAGTGGLSLLPGLGFNGALIESDLADIVIKALKTNKRARVMSSPRILVNDNATGILESLSEEPYTSLNTSNAVTSSESFGGFVEAGTTIDVTPHISEGDHLTLEYAVTLNSFDGSGSDGIPPPRNTNKIESDITVPDGHTVIVGGLNRKDFSDTVDAIPLLGEIPLIKHLFSSETKTTTEQTLFVFIRPIILRDDKFADLKLFSHTDLRLAELPGDYPQSEPLTVE